MILRGHSRPICGSSSYRTSLTVLDQLRILVYQRHHRVSAGSREEEDRSLRSRRFVLIERLPVRRRGKGSNSDRRFLGHIIASWLAYQRQKQTRV
jgi:hypothetical protein